MRVRVMAVVTAVLTLWGLTWVTSAAHAQPIAHPRLVNPDPANFTPHVLDGEVWAVAEVGNRIVLGGSFTQAQNASGGAILTRNRILSFDKTTGAIDANFTPSFNSTVRTLVASPDGQSVYVGGQFGTLNGVTVPKALRLNITNGARIAQFAPQSINAAVWDMKLSGSRLFIGGAFTRIGTQTRTALAELDPTTGALRPTLNFAFAGTHNGGQTFVHKFDVSPNGSTMVVTGNFATLDGQDRMQIAMLDLTTTPPSIADWQTEQWKPMCYSVFQYYLNDVDFAPDGSYFVLTSMGGYGSGPPTLCDTVTRWPSADRGAGRTPTWAAYSGGDSIYAVAATEAAIYVGGHHRWFNNPFAADAAGPGAVGREGIAALDPANGLPLNWNPGRTRGQGVLDILSTNSGLWVVSDTDRIGRFEYHGRVAYFPLTGGSAVPQPAVPSLPAEVGLLGSLPQATNNGHFLYRVNAGGGEIAAVDNGPNWVPDGPYVNTGNSAGWNDVPTVDASVPGSTPRAVYSSERWDAGSAEDGGEMHYAFPVTVGKQVQVRLYLANRYGGTSQPGQRVFDVNIEGGPVELNDYDIVADVGHDVGTMKAFMFTSDGTVDIDFGHVVENPLVNAIEIVDPAVPVPDGSENNTATRRTFDGTTVGPTNPLPSSATAWGSVRGSFFADGRLWSAWSNGTWTVRSYNGSSFGPETALNLYGLGAAAADAQGMTGLFYENGRIYYTLAGDPTLHYRYFSVHGGIIGAQRFDVSAGISFANVQGAFIADDGLYWVDRADGTLHRLTWSQGLVSGPDTTVSGPAQDGNDWRARALFTRS